MGGIGFCPWIYSFWPMRERLLIRCGRVQESRRAEERWWFVAGCVVMVVALVTVLSTSARAEERAYVANSGSDTVSVIDTATDLVIDTIAVGRIPNGIATTPNGVAVYVVNGGSPGAAGSVSMIDTTTNTVRATVPVGSNPYGVTVAPDGSLVYVANSNSGTLSVIETASNLVKTTIPVGRNPTAVAISPDGTVAYVADVDFP